MGSGVVPRDTLSLSVYLSIAIQRLLGGGGLSPNFGGRGGVRGSSVVPRESPSQWTYFVCHDRNAISLRLRVNRNTRFMEDRVPTFVVEVEQGNRVWYHVKVLNTIGAICLLKPKLYHSPFTSQ